MDIQKQELIAGQLVKAACGVIEQKIGHSAVSEELVAELYFSTKKVLNQTDFYKVPEDYKDKEALERFVADALPISFFMTAIIQREAKNSLTPELIPSFRQAVLSVFNDSPLQGSAKAVVD